MILDAHCHLVPPCYAEALKKHGRLLEDGFPVPAWSPESQLSFLSEAGIDRAVISVSSPHPWFGNPEEAAELCRQINEEASELCKESDGRIFFSAVLPLPDVEAAVKEAGYALELPGCVGIKLASNAAGQYLGAPETEPLMAFLNEKHAVVNIHPAKPAALTEGIFTSGPVPLFEFIADTTRAVMNLMVSGFMDRYPHVSFIVPHNGSFLPNISDRFVGITRILGPKGLIPEIDVEGLLKRLYFDTAGQPLPVLLDLAASVADNSHILYGSDYPYTPVPEVLKTKAALTEKLTADPRYQTDTDRILGLNAASLYGI